MFSNINFSYYFSNSTQIKVLKLRIPKKLKIWFFKTLLSFKLNDRREFKITETSF